MRFFIFKLKETKWERDQQCKSMKEIFHLTMKPMVRAMGMPVDIFFFFLHVKRIRRNPSSLSWNEVHDDDDDSKKPACLAFSPEKIQLIPVEYLCRLSSFFSHF